MSSGANPTAAVIIIGNEILSGRTRDANLAFFGRRCDELGIRLVEARVIPDNEEVIINTVNECRRKQDYVFTTGGIGPTHDDITSASIARAFGVGVERNPHAVAAMNKYYPPGKLNDARLKMADVPQGAVLIDNPVSGAPGFRMENVFVFPGVPSITREMFEGITDQLTGGQPILSASIRTNLTEGAIAGDLGRIQNLAPEVSIGSYPYFRDGKPGVNLVVRSTEPDRLDTVVCEIRVLISELGGEVLNPDDADQ